MIALVIFSLSLRRFLVVRIISCFQLSLPLVLAVCPLEHALLLDHYTECLSRSGCLYEVVAACVLYEVLSDLKQELSTFAISHKQAGHERYLQARPAPHETELRRPRRPLLAFTYIANNQNNSLRRERHRHFHSYKHCIDTRRCLCSH